MQQIHPKQFSTEPATGAGAQPLQILMADDDPNEHLLTVLAAEESGIAAEFTFVDDGTELLIALNRSLETNELPDLILLDLRMPRLDGHRTLTQLQAHPVLWQIPVVVFSTSTRREDIEKSFRSGARWVETKPGEFSGMVDFVKSLPSRASHDSYAFDSPESKFTRRSSIDIDLSEFEL